MAIEKKLRSGWSVVDSERIHASLAKFIIIYCNEELLRHTVLFARFLMAQ